MTGWALDIADRLATVAELEAPSIGPPAGENRAWHPMSLADGYPGLALVFAGSPDRDDRSIGHRLLRRGLSAGQPAHESLFRGRPAVAFAARVLAQAPRDYAKLLASIDDAVAGLADGLLTHEEDRLAAGRPGARMRCYDVSFGLTGLGRLFLTEPVRRPLLDRVLSYLVRLTEPVTPGVRSVPGWWTPDPAVLASPLDTPRGHLNPGLAHGVAGPLALLALARLAGAEVKGQAEAAARIAEWLLARRGHDRYGPFWPAVIPLEHEESGSVAGLPPSRVAWCYGAPGIARALQLAARAFGEPGWEHAALSTLGAALVRPWAATGIRDASLCHGSAGVLHIVRLVDRDASSPGLLGADEAVDQLSEHVRLFADAGSRFGVLTTPVGAAGLLEGAAGVVLAARGGPAAPPTSLGWDSALLLS